MLDYVFFHPVPYQRFIDFVHGKGLTPRCTEQEESFEVSLPETLDDDLSEEIEACYDQLMELNQTLFERELDHDSDNYHAAGVVVNLADGQTVYADVPPALLGKVMSVLTPQEFGDMVNAIVDAIENPDERSLCQRMRDDS
jgi:hypothetical protein